MGCTLYVMLTRSPPFHDDAQTRSGIEAREQGKFYKTAAYESFLGGSFIGDFELREYVWSFFFGEWSWVRLVYTFRLSDEAKVTASDSPQILSVLCVQLVADSG